MFYSMDWNTLDYYAGYYIYKDYSSFYSENIYDMFYDAKNKYSILKKNNNYFLKK